MYRRETRAGRQTVHRASCWHPWPRGRCVARQWPISGSRCGGTPHRGSHHRGYKNRRQVWERRASWHGNGRPVPYPFGTSQRPRCIHIRAATFHVLQRYGDSVREQLPGGSTSAEALCDDACPIMASPAAPARRPAGERWVRNNTACSRIMMTYPLHVQDSTRRRCTGAVAAMRDIVPY